MGCGCEEKQVDAEINVEAEQLRGALAAEEYRSRKLREAQPALFIMGIGFGILVGASMVNESWRSDLRKVLAKHAQ